MVEKGPTNSGKPPPIRAMPERKLFFLEVFSYVLYFWMYTVQLYNEEYFPSSSSFSPPLFSSPSSRFLICLLLLNIFFPPYANWETGFWSQRRLLVPGNRVSVPGKEVFGPRNHPVQWLSWAHSDKLSPSCHPDPFRSSCTMNRPCPKNICEFSL